MLGKRSAPKWAVIGALVLLLATTALAAAQSPDVLLPLITGEGQAEPEMPGDEGTPPLVEEELDPNAPIGDSQDTNSGDSYLVPAEPAAIDAFNATQWTVQNYVGIGTQTPTADIDLSRNVNTYTRLLVRNPNSGGAAQSQLYLNTGNPGVVLQKFGVNFSASWGAVPLATRARLRTTPTSAGLIVTTGGAYPLILGTADQERMRITPDGKVGIGTTSPQAKLHVQGASAVDGVEVNQPGGVGVYVIQPGYDGVYVDRPGTNGVYVYHPANHGLSVLCPCGSLTHPNTGVIVYGGNIRVDDGSFIANNTTLNVPDYVFEPEYPLMSLDKLRAHVTEEKHLPNVPSEEEIRAGGLDLSDFQMKLLEKTEELTLYTLAQDEQLQSQGEQIEHLQQENENLQQIVSLLQQQNADLETRLAALEEQE